MLKTSHLQELKRRYREMYAPKPEELDEHCGVCGEGGEQGIEEGKPSRKLAQRDVGMECQECGVVVEEEHQELRTFGLIVLNM